MAAFVGVPPRCQLDPVCVDIRMALITNKDAVVRIENVFWGASPQACPRLDLMHLGRSEPLRERVPTHPAPSVTLHEFVAYSGDDGPPVGLLAPLLGLSGAWFRKSHGTRLPTSMNLV